MKVQPEKGTNLKKKSWYKDWGKKPLIIYAYNFALQRNVQKQKQEKKI